MVLETNIFPITNLNTLAAQYRLCRIRGLRKGQRQYYENCQSLQKKLSYRLRQPVTVTERSGEPYLVVPADVGPMPVEYPLVLTKVQIEPLDEVFELDFAWRDPDTDSLCVQFLHFAIQAPLWNNARLWQPQSGGPFYERQPAQTFRGIQLFSGFRLRPTWTAEGRLGLCLDPVHCYVSATPLPTALDRDTFDREWKGKHCVYHFGDQWYTIAPLELDDRRAGEYPVQNVSGRWTTLLEYIHDRARKPISPELANLGEDTAVVLYRNRRDEDRAAPAPLCYPVVELDRVQGNHRLTIPAPYQRYSLTHQCAEQYLQKLKLGDTRIEVDLHPLKVGRCTITVPDLRFGHEQVLSVRGTPGARQIHLAELGKARLAMLRDESAGFYVNTPLDRQYFILPRSICDSMGDQFLKDLKATMDSLFPQPGSYCPTVIPYNYHVKKSFVGQARAALEAVAAFGVQPGYGVVMLHRTYDRVHRQEDQLTAAVVRELFENHQLRVGVMHCDTVRECYREVVQSDGQRQYDPDPSQRGRLSGYLRNVALNKILLINRKWPFILADRLHADITIGIDVKNNTCGLLAVGRFGADIRPFLKTSRQQEQLQPSQVKKYLCEVLREEASATSEPIRTIVIHRDGTLWPSELEGVQQAIAELKQEGVIPLDATLTVLEILKLSPAPLRLYGVTEGSNSNPWIENAEVGDCYIVNDTEAYLCTTGQPFLRQGTARPLHVKRVAGSLPLLHCLEDLYALTVLAWTQPEGCTRDPITLKLNDRYLRDEATDYDADALDFAEFSDNEEVA